MQGVTVDEPVVLGKFRTDWKLLDGTGDTVQMIFKAQSLLNQTEMKAFLESLSKIQRDFDHLGRRTDAEKKIWSTIAFIPMDHKAIEAAMVLFFQKLTRDLYDESIDPVVLAGRTVTEFIQIFPYDIGCGRISRILLHLILGDYLVIPDDAEYIRAMNDAVDGKIPLEVYLRKLISWKNEHKELL